MMKFIAILALVSSLSAAASKDECIAKLTNGYLEDSRAFKVDLDSINVLGHEKDYLAQGVSIIRGLLDLHGCDGQSDINFGHGPLGRTKSNCTKVVKEREYSVSCYIETDLGFFFVTRDLQTNAYIMYSRWD